MLNFGNKEFRNLQEQVLKNMKDIQDIEQGATVLADFGIKIVGQVNTAAELPDPATYKGDYGDGYVVGESEPYNYYIFTRAFEGQEEPSWFDLGQFPVPGPTGPQGPQGETGATPVIIMQAPQVSTLNPGQPATASVNVGGTTASPSYQFNFGIPQGAQGVQGPAGAQGPQGPQGPKGDKGDKGEQGGLIEIVGIVATANDLPTPASLQKLDAAYLVGASPDYELYVQVGTTPSTALWTNLGKINEGTVVTVNGVPQTVWEAEGKFLPVTEGLLVDTVYGQKAGTGQGQTHVPYGQSATGNALVQRDASGQVIVPATPSSSVMATSKGYVDNAVASVLPTQQAGDLIVGTSTANVATRLAIGSSGQYLKVNSSGNGLEYGDVDALPAIQSGDAGKVLTVSANEAGTEWTTVSSGGGSGLDGMASLEFSSSSNTSPKNVMVTGSNYGTYYPTVNSTGVFGNLFIGDRGNYSSLTLKSNSSVSLYDNIIVKPPFNDNSSNAYIRATGHNNIILFDGNASSSEQQVYLTGENSYVHITGLANVSSGSFYCKDSVVPSFNANGSTVNAYDSLVINRARKISGNALNIRNAIVCVSGTVSLNAYNPTYFGGNNSLGAGGSILCANSPKFDVPPENQGNGLAIFGNLPIYDSSSTTDRMIVGAGTDTSSRANCFTTGKDGDGNMYIKIGSTKITETQLQALLATL